MVMLLGVWVPYGTTPSSKTVYVSLPLIVSSLAPGPWIVRLMLGTTSGPLVRVIVP